MPFLRVLRDKRGYETTYLLHWFRDGNRQRSRILYVFRTPPGVRVGRDVLDPAVVREIEAEHPDIEFDWRALLENRQMIDNTPDVRRQRGSKPPGRPDRGEGRTRRKERDEDEPVPQPAPAAPAAPVAAPAPSRPAVPSAIEGDTREAQLAFLAKWYPELRDRVARRTQDPVRAEALLALTERLNPAAWKTEEEIVAGLQEAAEALERLSRVFSPRRRRPRRSKPADAQARGAEPDARPPGADAPRTNEPD